MIFSLGSFYLLCCPVGLWALRIEQCVQSLSSVHLEDVNRKYLQVENADAHRSALGVDGESAAIPSPEPTLFPNIPFPDLGVTYSEPGNAKDYDFAVHLLVIGGGRTAGWEATCSGAIWHRWVLTAKHCVEQADTSYAWVYVNSPYSHGTLTFKSSSSNHIKHPTKDLALLVLDGDTSYMPTAKIILDTVMPSHNHPVFMAGYGLNERGGSGSFGLLAAPLYNSILGSWTNYSYAYARFGTYQASMKGDSGAPWFYRADSGVYHIFAIHSGGDAIDPTLIKAKDYAEYQKLHGKGMFMTKLPAAWDALADGKKFPIDGMAHIALY